MTGNNPLIIGPEQQLALQQLRAKANASPMVATEIIKLVKTARGRRQHHARMMGLTVHIPLNYSVTFSVDVQPEPLGTCRHMSMSSGRVGKGPLPEAVWMVCEKLGFTGSLNDCIVHLEDIGDGEKAINVLQRISATVSTTPS